MIFFNVTRCDGVEDYNTFEEIHCLQFKFLVLFLSHIGPLFLSQHICMPNIAFLLKMWVQFLMYDACQHLSGHITSKILFKTKIWVVMILEYIYIYWNHDYFIFLSFKLLINEANNSTLSQVYNPVTMRNTYIYDRVECDGVVVFHSKWPLLLM